MKKMLLSILAVALLLISLVGCGKGGTTYVNQITDAEMQKLEQPLLKLKQKVDLKLKEYIDSSETYSQLLKDDKLIVRGQYAIANNKLYSNYELLYRNEETLEWEGNYLYATTNITSDFNVADSETIRYRVEPLTSCIYIVENGKGTLISYSENKYMEYSKEQLIELCKKASRIYAERDQNICLECLVEFN